MSNDWTQMGYIAQTKAGNCLLIAIGTGNDEKQYGIVDLKDLKFVLDNPQTFAKILKKEKGE